MRIIRSARGWATATVTLVLVLLIGTTILALFGTREQQSHLESLEATSLYAGALETARAEFLGASADLAAAGFTQDQSYLLMYENDIATARRNLLQARAIALSEARETDVVLVDEFIARVDSYNQGIGGALALFLVGDEEGAARNQNDLTATATGLAEDLRVAAEREQNSVTAQRAAAVETSGRSFELQLILGVFAFVAATVAGVTLVARTRQLEQSIEQRKQAQERIRYLAYHDALTGLPNRTFLEDRLATTLAQARRKGRTLALLYLDLDRFKRVNEAIGHTLGDHVLQSLAERLTAIVRDADTVARVGGDEFTILLPKTARVQDAIDVADRVLEGLRQPLLIERRELRATASMGIAVYPNDAEEADTLMRNAAIAMYRTKEQGGDSYQLYTPAMNAAVADPLALESDLRRALEREELVVYYQPQVSIANGQIVGVEALVRWQHPERGLVLPADFIPLAEETGLIISLGEWVLRTACAQAKAWQDAGLPPVRVAVNISGRQFQDRALGALVDQVLKETGLRPQYLQLEVTEGVTMRDMDFTIEMLSGLKEMGVQIAIDDFGSGHSSLNYLKRLPIDDVKIDKSFVKDLATDPNDGAIVRSIIAMTHELNLKVVAEGVETQQQLSFLQDRRCDVAQGMLFSEPVPAEALENTVKHGVPVQAPASGP